MGDFIEKALSFYIGNVICYFALLVIGTLMGFFTLKRTAVKDLVLTLGLGLAPVLNLISTVAMLEELKFSYDQRKWRKRQAELRAAIEESVV